MRFKAVGVPFLPLMTEDQLQNTAVGSPKRHKRAFCLCRTRIRQQSWPQKSALFQA